VFHTGNGNASAGTHCWSADGKVWYGQTSPPAYTGHMSWADDTSQPYAGKETILARRERPQILLKGEAGMVRKSPFWEHFIVCIKTIILPRQARDKRREKPSGKRRFSQGSSYGTPYLLFTSAEDCVYDHMPDGGKGDPCTEKEGGVGSTKSYTVLAQVASA
jgi:hypothetical protein